jgi:hypothetical protein
MKELLISFVRWPAAILWVWVVGPCLARLFGFPIRTAFWKPDRQNQQLTRPQFIWAFGLLVFGIGFGIVNLDSDTIHTFLLAKSWSAKLVPLGFQLALSIVMGTAIAFWCAPAQLDEPPVTKLDLS